MVQAAIDQRQCVVGALIVDGRGRVFVHRRSLQRRLFPRCWDTVGGQVEAGEDLLAALEPWPSPPELTRLASMPI
jgi:8-oxo-dGTP pyrophosphatase MutT (NUDIX family)